MIDAWTWIEQQLVGAHSVFDTRVSDAHGPSKKTVLPGEKHELRELGRDFFRELFSRSVVQMVADKDPNTRDALLDSASNAARPFLDIDDTGSKLGLAGQLATPVRLLSPSLKEPPARNQTL